MTTATLTDPRKPAALNLPPPISSLTHLRPSNTMGAAFLSLAATTTVLAIFLSNLPNVFVWCAAQCLLSLAMVLWFAMIHEAGHKTLFKTARLNRMAGHVASLFAGIPFENWKIVHGGHHRWTGWQDLDATTATLVPRKLARWERAVLNVCWKLSIPLFSVLYRLQNYWNLPRLYRFFPRPEQRRRLVWNSLLLLGIYGTVIFLVGVPHLLQLFGLALLLTLVMQDILILSQHTHVPMKLSHGEEVEPFAAMDQEIFTRSMKFPLWFSTLVLLNMDEHELHHMYPSIPGYYLPKIDYATHNSVCWWRWLWRAKAVPGEVFLMQNRNQSGFDI